MGCVPTKSVNSPPQYRRSRSSSRGDRVDRVDRGDRGDRGNRGDRVDRVDRGDRVDRVDRGSRNPPPTSVAQTQTSSVKVSHRRSVTHHEWTTIVDVNLIVSGTKVGLPVVEDRSGVDSLEPPSGTLSRSHRERSPSVDPKLEQFKRVQAKEKSRQWQRRTYRSRPPPSNHRAQTQSSIN
jgi:hypothetical protein